VEVVQAPTAQRTRSHSDPNSPSPRTLVCPHERVNVSVNAHMSVLVREKVRERVCVRVL
jgi:hypothetical protein